MGVCTSQLRLPLRAASIVYVTTCCRPYVAEDHASVRNRAGQGRGGAEEKLCHTCFSPSALIFIFFKKKPKWWHDKSRHHATHRLDRCLSKPTTRIRVAAWRTTPSPTHTHRPPSKTNFLNSVPFSRFFLRCNYTAASPIR